MVLCLVAFLFSCGSKKDVIYFQDIPNKATLYTDNTVSEVRIAPGDNLFITVLGESQLATAQFNVITTERGNINNDLIGLLGYLVDDKGEINFPLIGKVYVAGLSKDEATNLLQDKIAVFINDPIVNIRFLNYKITVLGEVARPGTYSVNDEKISIPEALSLAGDLTIYGERHNVVLMRTDNDQKEFYSIDLTDPGVVFSPLYFLKQNDILYISPNRAKIRSSSLFNQNASITISLVSITMTLIAFFGLKK
jgi:polysaccharide export outer membrane protein